METVAIVGVGLIGGSFGLALKKAGFRGTILGVSSEAVLRAGLAWFFAVFEVMGGVVSPTARSNSIAPQDPRRSLPVVPLIPHKRYYGEAPADRKSTRRNP